MAQGNTNRGVDVDRVRNNVTACVGLCNESRKSAGARSLDAHPRRAGRAVRLGQHKSHVTADCEGERERRQRERACARLVEKPKWRT